MVHIERPHIGARRPGRPTTYSEALASAILVRLALGESLRAICDADAAMPDRSTVTRWLVRHEDFAARYQQAREIGRDVWLDMIADHLRTPPARDAAGRLDPVAARRHRDQAGTMRWLADKLKNRGRATAER